jgi:hypothetical protein
MIDIDRIGAENKRRKGIFASHYDPLTGAGSHIERFAFPMSKDETLFLPMSMQNDPVILAAIEHGSYHDLMARAYVDMGTARRRAAMQRDMRNFVIKRISHDFEFWAYIGAKISNKEADVVPFKLNYAQLVMLAILEGMRLAGIPIRIILLKARQWGGSTLLRLYMGWVQLFLKEGWGSAIVTTVEDQALHIRGMFDLVAQEHPPDIFNIEFKPYKGSTKNRVIVGRRCVVGVGSYEKPNSLRSFTFQMLHLSECAFWQKTKGKSPEQLISSLKSTVPRIPYSLIALESTAKGVGNFFHKEWLSAENGSSGYHPVFVPWFHINEYSIPIKENDYSEFVATMTDADWQRWELGATLEGIYWYRSFKAEENYSDESMMEEYPSTANEAFISSGARVFPQKYTLKVRKTCRPPEFVGELTGETVTGPDSLKNIQFHTNVKGGLSIWALPDRDIPVKDRYVVFVDIGGRTQKADKSVIRVLDRYWLLEGGVPEFVCTWRGNIDHDVLAWKAAQVAKWYCNALLIVEDASLEKEDDGSGHFFTILDQIADHYENLFSRTDPDKIKQGVAIKYGFSTNMKTKPMIIDTLLAAARDELYIERDGRAVDEMETFEQKPNKRLGAQDGCHDDMVITTAGCVWASYKHMDMPEIIIHRPVVPKHIISEASI